MKLTSILASGAAVASAAAIFSLALPDEASAQSDLKVRKLTTRSLDARRVGPSDCRAVERLRVRTEDGLTAAYKVEYQVPCSALNQLLKNACVLPDQPPAPEWASIEAPACTASETPETPETPEE